MTYIEAVSYLLSNGYTKSTINKMTKKQCIIVATGLKTEKSQWNDPFVGM